MDSIQEIAISKIADILSNEALLRAEIDIWKKIFYNVGLSKLYDDNATKLQCRLKPGFHNEYEHNGKCYSALREIFLSLSDGNEIFVKLMQSIIDKISIYSLLDIEEVLNTSIFTSDVVEYMKEKNLFERLDLLDKYPSSDLKSFRSNLNILGFDFTFDKEKEIKLLIMPFSFVDKSQDKTLLTEWLKEKHENILVSYESALKAHGNGDNVATLTHCRNVLTGIFTYDKTDLTKWYTGLQKACKSDKNISNVTAPNNIASWKNGDVHNPKIEMQYNYPRFKTITQLYSFLCDLGPHINEAPKLNGIPDYETVSNHDALLGLRMTEDVLIWLYQNQINE